MPNKKIHLVECPRDAMQGLSEFIPTAKKIEYINQLAKVGFGTLDCLSFVSPKAIPQMKDSAEVVKELDKGASQVLAIVANQRGVDDALKYAAIDYLGFPLSVSEEFQRRNTNKSIEQALLTVEEMIVASHKEGKRVVVYLSMAFGNPYNEEWSVEQVLEIASSVSQLGADVISLADTIGNSDAAGIQSLYSAASSVLTHEQLGLHLHSNPKEVVSKIEAAIETGCTRMDGALLGIGGCPMAKDDLVGNMPMEQLVSSDDQIGKGLNPEAYVKALSMARELFS